MQRKMADSYTIHPHDICMEDEVDLMSMGPGNFWPGDMILHTWGKVSGTNWELYESRCPSLGATPPYPPPHPPQPFLNLFRLCHSWPTTLTMSFSLLPFTYTQAAVIVSRFDSGFDCASPPPGKPPWKPNKETMGLLSRQMNGCTLGKYFSEMEQEQERGRISCCQLKSKHPTSCQWASISTLRCTDVSPSV